MLRGTGCQWRQCTFCDYHLDYSRDEDANYLLNQQELDKVTGRFHRLEIINSGSFNELDEKTIRAIGEKCLEKRIAHLHFEMHWMHRREIPKLRRYFQELGIFVHVKMGVETFDSNFRDEVLKKGMHYATPVEIQAYADDVCLLFGLEGQTVDSMRQDIETGLRLFQRVCINIMTANSTKVRPDEEVTDCFRHELYPLYKDNPRIDILINNTDFGVGGTIDDE